MISLFSFIPRHCPSCGEALVFKDNLAQQDFFAGCAHTCDCGLHYAYADGPKILELAAVTGDMGRYVKPEDVR